MTPQKHTLLTGTAAIAAALAFTATPLSAQSVDPSATSAPAAQPEAAGPPPATSLPDAGAASDASPAPAPDTSASTAPAATGASDSVTPVRHSATSHSTVTRTTTVTHTAPAAIAAPMAAPALAPTAAPAPTEVVPPPADMAPVAAPPPLPAPEPTPVQPNNVVSTMGLALLALLALAILAAGLLFFRRRHPAAVIATRETEPVVTEVPAAAAPIAEPAPSAPMASASMYRLRDSNPVAGALPSDGAAVDLPARLPESYDDRAALFERMVAARPDKANPFTDRHARSRRARLIMQSIGHTFDREPRIDLSQYPNNWPELARQYHKAA